MFRRMNGHRPHLTSNLAARTPSLLARLSCRLGKHSYRIDKADYYSIATHCFNCGIKSPRGYGE